MGHISIPFIIFPDILNTTFLNQFTVFLPYTDKNKQYLDRGIITQENFTFQGRRVMGELIGTPNIFCTQPVSERGNMFSLILVTL